MPNDSGGSVVRRNRSAARRTSGSSGWGTAPRKWTRSPTPRSPARRAEVVDQLAAARDDDVDARVAQLGEGVDRDVEALEVMGAVEGGDEGGDDRVVRDAEPLAEAGPIRARAEPLGVDAVRHLDELRRVALAGAPEVGDRLGVIGAEDADAVGGPDQRGRDGVLVGLEQEPAARRRRPAGSCSGRGEPASGAFAEAPEERQVRAEDERVVEVDDVEAVEPGEAGDERCVADREDRLGPVDVDALATRGSHPARAR